MLSNEIIGDNITNENKQKQHGTHKVLFRFMKTVLSCLKASLEFLGYELFNG